MTPRIQKAIDIFLDAINEGHLAKGHCAACAVGNLCAHAINYKPYLSNGDRQPNMHWASLFMTVSGGSQYLRPRELSRKVEEALILISKTEFTESELANIEYAFETNTMIHWQQYGDCTKQEIRSDQIRGLEAVIKVMLTFDNQKDEVNEVFTKRAELIPV